MAPPTAQSMWSAPPSAGRRLGGWAGAGLMASTLLILCPAARAEGLTAWQFDPATQQLTITLPSGVTPTYRVDRDAAQGTTQIVLTIPQTQMGAVAAEQQYSGAVTQVRLSQVNADTVVVLAVAPDAVLTAEGASLVAIAAGDQTRWVLTALAAPTLASPGTAAMVVDLPVIPSTDPRLGFPAAGTGRLSTSAANLMLPSDIDSLMNLPETLPVDPFNLARPGEQVTVPSLAELDAVVGPVAIAPAIPAPAPAQPAATSPVLAQEPPSSGARAVAAPVAQTPDDPTAAAIDQDSGGLPIAVSPLDIASPATPDPTAAPAAEPVPSVPTAQPVPSAIAVDPPAPTAAPTTDGAIATPPPTAAPVDLPSPVVPTVIAVEPPAAGQAPATAPARAVAGNAQAIAQEPPPLATVPVELVGADPTLLTVPAAPSTTSQGVVTPPEPSLTVAAAGNPIYFGAPLPPVDAAFPSGVSPAPANQPLSPDTLVAAGTVLALRYVGNEPLDLNASSSQNQVLLLAQDIRDPMTNGIVAPAGSQLIGQFESTPQGHRWISRRLIAPAGQQVDFASRSEYMVGTPDVSAPRMAAGAGLGALALLLVTGFTGIGLVGGAVVGATTAFGTSPQHIMIEPNQVIQVQVIQDVPRSIPIATAPEYSREWGAGGW